MKKGILINFLFCVISCLKFQELPKYDTISVIPGTRVYLDISSFEVGQSIYLDFTMDLFFYSKESRDSYTFQIDQVPTKYEDDYIYWGNLPYVTTKNVSSITKDYTYTWVEIKKKDMNYIFIIPPEPFDRFYTFWKNKIIITNVGGISAREIRKRVISYSIPFIVIIILGIIIFSLYKRRRYNYNNINYPPAFPVLELNSFTNQNSQQPQTNQPLMNQQQEYPKPISPMVQPSVQLMN